MTKKDNTIILSPDFVQKYKNKQPKWGFNGLGYIVYKRTYSRPKEDGTLEEWFETIERCINGAQKIGAGYTKREAEKLFDLVFNLKCNFAGRGLWQLGTSTVDRFGGNSLLNCWFTAIKKPEDFCFIFENLMLGGGVGYSIRREDIHELPRVKRNVEITVKNTNDADFIVPDSREGWVRLLSKVLEACFVTGKSFNYSTVLVRSAGKPIGGFGGTASGPEILVDGIEKICGVIKEREGKKLRSLDVLDIANIIGSVVVAGNVRRSAEIALGDPDDYLYIKAKRWDLGNIPNWRAMSNNTIYCDSYDHIAEGVWDGYAGNGEPYGFFNVMLSSKFGRTGEKAKENCEGTNPCGEISLADKECCNLAELYLNNIESKQELIECSKLLYKTQKAICALPFIHDDTNKIVHKNFRIGQGVTGICQGLHNKKLGWLDDCYKALKAFDQEWSKKQGWPESIKLTTVKPSGTLSLLAGATPGVHPAYSQYYIRRVRMSSQDALVETCKGMGYHVEFVKNFDGTLNRDTVIVEFPCESGDNAKLAKDMTAIDQLELVKRIQKEWSDNAVSCTVYYNKGELGNIKEWLRENYKNNIKSVSFLLHSEHGFLQAPYEEISQENYQKLCATIKKVTAVSVGNGQTIEGLECEGGACPIR
jgi:ribonucleotide reductase alpha subunit|tara:strand:+ start:5079 stop:7019 length:1941 start_codon:yes stop_codon:yes gene_type:complete